MILLWLNLQNDLEKIPNLSIYDWRKIHHDRKDFKVVFSYVILVYKRKKRKGSCTTYFREEYSLTTSKKKPLLFWNFLFWFAYEKASTIE